MVNEGTEIRKLPIGELNSLARKLESDAWKILMASIKVPGSTSVPRFTHEDVRLIEEAGKNQGRSAAEVFLSEWCTMGQTRPTVGSMIQLLVETNLLRAADYLAVDVLKGEPPERPKVGPAAEVDMSKLLDQLAANATPRAAEFDNRSTIELNLNEPSYPSHNPPAAGHQSNERVIDMHFFEQKVENVQDCPIVQKTDLIEFSKSVTESQDSGSDLIKFSSSIPDEVKVMTDENEISYPLPSFSQLGINEMRTRDDGHISSSGTRSSWSIDSSEVSAIRTDTTPSSHLNLPAMSQILPDELNPATDTKIDQSQSEISMSSGNVQNVPVPVLEFFRKS